MDVSTIAKNTNTVFSLPEVALQINELTNQGDAQNIELEEVIRHDPALTAKILKFANSAFFGFTGEIDTISQAITLIGHKELNNLALATSVTSTFSGISHDLVDMESYWYHSVVCGIAAKFTANHLKQAEKERFFIGGLLHGIGKLIIYDQFPESSVQILNQRYHSEQLALKTEREILGFTYAELGAELLKQWQLPANIWELIKFQTDPQSNNEFIDDACILHIAVHIANSIQPCAKQNIDFDKMASPEKPAVWQHAGLDIAFIEPMMDEICIQAYEILGIIKPKASMVL